MTTLSSSAGAGGGAGRGAAGGSDQTHGFTGEVRESCVAEGFEVDIQALEHADADALTDDGIAGVHGSEEQVLGTDVGVAELHGLLNGELDEAFGAGGKGDVSDNGPLTTGNGEREDFAHAREVDADTGKHASTDAVGFGDDAEEQVLGADVVVVEADGLFLSQDEDSFGALGEAGEGCVSGVGPPIDAAGNRGPFDAICHWDGPLYSPNLFNYDHCI